MHKATDLTNSEPVAEILHVRLRRGLTGGLINTVFNQGSTFAVNVIIANLFGRLIFGEYAIILSTVLLLATVAQLAIGYTATRYVAEFRSVNTSKVGRILGLCAVIAITMASLAVLLLVVSAPWLATSALRKPHLAVALMIGSGFVFCTTINGYLLGALAGLESYKALGRAGIITGSSFVLLCVLAAWLRGLNGAIAGLGLSSLLQLLVLSWFLRVETRQQEITISYRGIWQEKNLLTKFALPAALSGLISIPLLWLANTFLVRQPGGYEQMALYSAASSFRIIILLLPSILQNVGMTIMTNQKGAGDKERYLKVFRTNIALTAGTVLGGALVVVMCGQWLLSAFGRNFNEGYPVLLVLVFAALLEAFAANAYQVMITQEKMWLALVTIVVPHYGTMIVVAFLITPSYGAVGLAIAYASGWLINLITAGCLAWRYREVNFKPIQDARAAGMY